MRKSEDRKRRRRLLRHDQSFLAQGFLSLAGVDEAGRGPLAGPVVASAVIVRDFLFRAAIDDSKRLTAREREVAYREILEKCVVGVGIIAQEVIDEITILGAAMLAMEEAVRRLAVRPDCVLIDGTKTPALPYRQYAITDGDAKSFSIACASIVAKVTRDRMMNRYHELYPDYGFKDHKGYGTRAHVEALKKYGPCKIHRRSFEPVRSSWKPS